MVIQKESAHQHPVYLLHNGYIVEGLVGQGVTATDRERQAAISMGKCGNCFDVKAAKYPKHSDKECPYTTPSCLPRPAPHTPVACIKGFTHRASDPAIVDAFIKERTEALLAWTNNQRDKGGTSAKGAHGGKGGSSPIGSPERILRFQPMRAIHDQDMEEFEDVGECLIPDEIPLPSIRAPHNQWSTSARKHG